MPTNLSLLLVGGNDELLEQVTGILHGSSYEPDIARARDLSGLQDSIAGLSSSLDLILCEYNSNVDHVHAVLDAIHDVGLDLPLIVLSEEDDTEAAVRDIRTGATDWIVTHHLNRLLIPAVDRALHDMREGLRSREVGAQAADTQRHYRDLAEAMPQVVFELDRTGHFTFVNRCGLEMFCYTPEDVERGLHVTSLMVEDQRARAADRLQRVMAGEELDHGAEYTVVTRDGTRFPALVYSTPLVQSGRIVGTRGILIDLRGVRETERQLQASEERYRGLVEAMGDGLVTIDRTGTITFTNQALADMLEVTVKEIIGQDLRELFDQKNALVVAQQLERRFRDGVPASYELETRSASGRQLNLLVTATPLHGENGEIVGSLGVITDITNQRHAHEHLLRIKAALDNTSDAICITDANRTPVYVNPGFTKMFGYALEELCEIGGPIANFAREEECHRVLEHLENSGSFAGEFEGRHRSDHTFPVMGLIDAIRDERDELAGFVALFTDISWRRRREERRRLATARLALLNDLNQMLNAGESIDDIIAAGADGLRDVLDAHHVHLFTRHTGSDEDELVMRYSNMPPDAMARVFGPDVRGDDLIMPLRPDSHAWEVYQTGEMHEMRAPEVDRLVDEIKHWASSEPLAGRLDVARGLGMRYLCFMPLMHAETAIGHITILRNKDEPLNEMEKDLLHAFADQMAVVLDKARSELEINRLNHFLRAIIDNAAVWFSVVDEDEQLIIWNRAAAEISGYSRENIESSVHLMRLLYPNEQMLREAYAHVTTAFHSENPSEFETTITRADGTQRRMAWHLQRFAITNRGVGLIVVGRDITESCELQEQLQRVQRMNAVGKLAGGIAHDFNNVLTAIIGHADLLAAHAEEGSLASWHAGQISRNAERASRLTRQLLAFSRRQPSRPQVVNLNRLIRDMREMFRRVIPENIDLQLDLSSDLGCTVIDPSQIEQIVMNLALNARDAMSEGGVLRITTRNAELAADGLTELFDAAVGDYVVLQVEDTGIGMDEEIEAHIFEPFYTTREATGGTGLGLSTVYGLVRQNKGAVTVYSEPGEGTLFRVYLPRDDRDRTTDEQSEGVEPAAVRGDETLLVVEDADNLRDLIATILHSFGYTVHTASQGNEALEIERSHRDEIDLVITDVVMPEMSGTELADRLIRVAPKLRVLFISGYPNERAINAGHHDRRFGFLQKPFSATELGQKVRQMLDSAG